MPLLAVARRFSRIFFFCSTRDSAPIGHQVTYYDSSCVPFVASPKIRVPTAVFTGKNYYRKKKISAFLTVILDSTQLLQADLDWSLVLSWAIRICPNREHIIPGLIGLQNKLYKLFRFVTGISTNQYPVTFLMTFSCHNSWENRILSTITPWRSINL